MVHSATQTTREVRCAKRTAVVDRSRPLKSSRISVGKRSQLLGRGILPRWRNASARLLSDKKGAAWFIQFLLFCGTNERRPQRCEMNCAARVDVSYAVGNSVEKCPLGARYSIQVESRQVVEESELQGLPDWATIEKFLLRFKSILLTKAIVRLGNEVHLVRKPFGSSRVPRSRNTVSPGWPRIVRFT